MPLLWSLAVAAGLLILVYLMIFGVPRIGDGHDTHSTPKTALPMLGTMCAMGGITGYLAGRWPSLVIGIRVGLAIGVGALAALGARWLVTAAFATPSADPEDDPRYRFQGHVAQVTRSISSTDRGLVVFENDGHRFELLAQSLDGAAVPAGTEVVIERVDDEIATVEPWAAVEQRL